MIRPGDTPSLIDLFSHLSPESRRRRFNLALEHIDDSRVEEEAQRLTAVDNRTIGGAILAFARQLDGDELIGVARLGRLPSDPASPEAEAALVVRDDFQSQGVGTALLSLLALLARRMDVKIMAATLQADNEALLIVLRSLHLPLHRHTAHGETTISLTVADIPVPKNPA